MEKIIIHNIDGGLPEFLNFINEKYVCQKDEGLFDVSPKFKVYDHTLGVELFQIILSGTATLMPLFVKIWEAYLNNKKLKNNYSINMEIQKNGHTIIISGKDLSYEEVIKMIELKNNTLDQSELPGENLNSRRKCNHGRHKPMK